MTRAGTLVLGLLSLAGPLAAQTTAPDSLLDHLLGDWVLQGQIAGRQVTHDVTVDRVLNRGYVQIHEISRERTAAGEPEYEAIVYISRDPETRRYAVLWLDSTGITDFDAEGIGHGEAVGDTIPFVFGSPDADPFHNTFRYDRTSDSWQWQLDNERAGERQPFARVTLTRR